MNSDGSKEMLILFTRFPEPGRTKTRLIPALGPEGAATLQRQMTQTMVNVGRRMRQKRRLVFEIRYDGGDPAALVAWLGKDLVYRQQQPGSLGRRICNAFEDAFTEGFEKVVIIGADCPGLTDAIIDQAFNALDKSRVVLGPAKDGGYYLIGQSEHECNLFTDIDWGTEKVMAQTVHKAKEHDIQIVMLEKLADIDRPEDIEYYTNNSNKRT